MPPRTPKNSSGSGSGSAVGQQAQQAQQISPFSIALNIDLQNDTYVIKGGAGVGVAHVKKPDGRVMSVHVHANGAFQQMTAFDPAKLTVDERRTLESTLYNKGMTQSEIADLVGKSQPTVANDLRILRQRGDIT